MYLGLYTLGQNCLSMPSHEHGSAFFMRRTNSLTKTSRTRRIATLFHQHGHDLQVHMTGQVMLLQGMGFAKGLHTEEEFSCLNLTGSSIQRKLPATRLPSTRIRNQFFHDVHHARAAAAPVAPVHRQVPESVDDGASKSGGLRPQNRLNSRKSRWQQREVKECL